MKQTTFASLAYAAKKKRTNREQFLDEMEGVVPWSELLTNLYQARRRVTACGRNPTTDSGNGSIRPDNGWKSVDFAKFSVMR
jgi:hypothetical protein